MNSELEFHVEGLESRKLLAVDVNFHGGAGRLKLTGDHAADDIQINGTGGTGHVEVFVNGNLEGAFTGVRSIQANLKGGDDKLSIGAIDIEKNLDIKMGDGADTFILDTTVFNFGVGNGVNGNTLIKGSVKVRMGGDAGDFVDWETSGADSLGIAKSLTIVGTADADLRGNGSTFNLETGDIVVGGNLLIRLSEGGDTNNDNWELDMGNVLVGGKTRIVGSGEADRMQLTDSAFLQRTSIHLGGGSDTLDMTGAGNENFFDQHVVFHGGGGQDTLLNNPANVYHQTVREISF